MERILEQYERQTFAEKQIHGANSNTVDHDFNVRTLSLSVSICLVSITPSLSCCTS